MGAVGGKAGSRAGLAAACRAADRCRMASAAIARLGLSAVGPDAVGAVLMDGHIRRLRPACRALDGAAALGGHQQGDQVFPVGHPQGLDHFLGVAGLIVLEQSTLQGLALGSLFHKTGLRV